MMLSMVDKTMIATSSRPRPAAEFDSLLESSDEGFDTLDFSSIAQNLIVDLGTSLVQNVHADRTITLSSTDSFEGLIGGTGNDSLTGNSQHNLLGGRSGSDTLAGLTGDDTYVFDQPIAAEDDVINEIGGQEWIPWTSDQAPATCF